MADNDEHRLTERMNNLAGKLAGLDPNDHAVLRLSKRLHD